MTRVSKEVAELYAKHELTQVSSFPEAYYLHEPGAFDEKGRLVSRMQSTYLLFTPEGIVVMGDLCPGRNGVISNLGYGVDWFSGRLSEDYLCSKFIEQSLHEDGFRAWLVDRKKEEEKARDESEDKEEIARAKVALGRIDEALEDLSMCDEGIDSVRDSVLVDLGEYGGEGQGYDYDPGEAGHLCAIQQRFSVLYAEKKAKIPLPIVGASTTPCTTKPGQCCPTLEQIRQSVGRSLTMCPSCPTLQAWLREG